LEALSIAYKACLDLSLDRDLYCAPFIFEVIYENTETSYQVQKEMSNDEQKSDNLVGMYNKRPIPSCGVSFGVDRIIATLKAQQERNHCQRARQIFTSWLLEVNILMLSSRAILD